MELRDDHPIQVDVDRKLVGDLQFVVDQLLETEHYDGVDGQDRDDVESELIQALLEYWIDSDFIPVGFMLEALQESTHVRAIEEAAVVLANIIALDGYPIIRNATGWVRQQLQDEPEKVYFYDIRLMPRHRVLKFTIGYESMD